MRADSRHAGLAPLEETNGPSTPNAGQVGPRLRATKTVSNAFERMKEYTYLAGAIVTEVIGTSALKLSNGFEHAALGGLAIALYVVSFYFVSQALTFLPVGLVYATWSAVGIVGLAAIGIVFDETVDLAAVVGFVLVIAGVVLLNVYSSAYNPV